jgi:TPR repeat protein
MASGNSAAAAGKSPSQDATESARAAAPAKTEPAAKREAVEDESDLGAASRPAVRNGSQPAAASAGSSSDDDQTTRIAEKYLYGDGVPQDCNRAVSLLRPAAEASQAKARTILGAMYATGHCVPRDLPSSYHWFALALRQQPNNIWVEKNLESVWNQMSPSEKQLAMRMTR